MTCSRFDCIFIIWQTGAGTHGEEKGTIAKVSLIAIAFRDDAGTTSFEQVL